MSKRIDSFVGIRLSDTEKERLQNAAHEEKRSVSSLARKVLVDHLDKRKRQKQAA